MGVRVSIIGATGYSGGELATILNRHRGVEIVGVYSGTSGKVAPFASLHPSLAKVDGPALEPYTVDTALKNNPHVVFLATPAEFSAKSAGVFLEAGIRVIDLSGAFRIRDVAEFEKWYGFSHPSPELIKEAVYGITELCGNELKSARLIANPGCYPTSAILALKPVMDLILPQDGIILDSASGLSGAGKQSSESYSFCETATNFKAYNVGTHKHEPEMREILGLSKNSDFVFTAHLLPVVRGILTTIHARLKNGICSSEIMKSYTDVYKDKPFVRIHENGRLPELKEVVGTPRADIGFTILPGGTRIVIVSAIDNMLKGAASQAVQNMNIMFGLDEKEGL